MTKVFGRRFTKPQQDEITPIKPQGSNETNAPNSWFGESVADNPAMVYILADIEARLNKLARAENDNKILREMLNDALDYLTCE